MFNTAECYGALLNPNEDEELLGEALAPYRDQIRLSTKFRLTFDWGDGCINHSIIADSRPETIRRSVNDSLTRLKTDHIDIYIQHSQDPNTPVEEVAKAIVVLNLLLLPIIFVTKYNRCHQI